ncbi:GNAT family N-acetyltransferase [Flavobacterium sp. SE-1-e]|uniref:GNAT family N-acetyltransferase n=2 Tax=Flavobacterium agrisoli TaxID=2793066 RepID=A0A934PPP9_9FLAO|nr:GNAT family N-acetyltransferase [Flavobacterium agrisoli]
MEDFYAIDHYPIDKNISKELLKEFISNENLGKAWFILQNNQIAGYIVLTFIFSFEYQGRIAFLDELFISESFRGNGLGKKAIEFIKTQIPLLSLKIVYLEIEKHNEKAQKLYLAGDFKYHNRNLMIFKP